jgi:hypothetical protein
MGPDQVGEMARLLDRLGGHDLDLMRALPDWLYQDHEAHASPADRSLTGPQA